MLKRLKQVLTAETDPEEPSYTQDEEAEIKRILKAENYYEVLEVSPTDDLDEHEEDLRASYLDKCDALNPNECKHPQLGVASAKLTEAYDTLCDPGARRKYNIEKGFEKEREPIDFLRMLFGLTPDQEEGIQIIPVPAGGMRRGLFLGGPNRGADAPRAQGGNGEANDDEENENDRNREEEELEDPIRAIFRNMLIPTVLNGGRPPANLFAGLRNPRQQMSLDEVARVYAAHVETLIQMGFTREQSLRALQITQGDINEAIEMLINQ